MSGGIDQVVRIFCAKVVDTRKWLGATETLWRTAPKGSDVRRSLGEPQLEALHEAAYIRIFGAWEDLQEELLMRFLCGHTTSSFAHSTLVTGVRRQRNLGDARALIYEGKPYKLWHNPGTVIGRAQKFVVGSPLETVLATNESQIGHYSVVRHRVAHSSQDAIDKFVTSATALSGVSHDGIAGRFLRSPNYADGLTMRMWIHIISEDLMTYAYEMAG